RELLGVAIVLERPAADLEARLGHRVGRQADGEPAVAPGRHTLAGVRPHAAEDDGWMRLLHGLRLAHDRGEADPSALERWALLGPELAHGHDRLAQERKAMREMRRQEIHLLPEPAGAHAEQEAAAGEQVERGHLVCGEQRVALG